MRKLSGVFALTMAFCLISASVFAQDERPARGGRGGAGGPGGGGPGGPGAFGGRGGMMGGMGMGMGGAMQLLGLLRMEEVRKEVGVSTEVYEAIQTKQREAMSGMANMRDASEEERTKMMKDMNTKAQELLDEAVEPTGMKRLMGLLVQQQGSSAVTNELIAKELKLPEETTKAIGEVLKKLGEENMASMRKMMEEAGGFQNLDRAKMTEMREENTKKTNAAVEEKLSAEQKKALEALKGEKFTFPEGGGFGGFGGPGGGRGGAAGGGRTRPGSDN